MDGRLTKLNSMPLRPRLGLIFLKWRNLQKFRITARGRANSNCVRVEPGKLHQAPCRSLCGAQLGAVRLVMEMEISAAKSAEAPPLTLP